MLPRVRSSRWLFSQNILAWRMFFPVPMRNWARIIGLDQKPQTLTVRARGPRRVSTICSPPLMAELP
jgi:hypothetical protein